MLIQTVVSPASDPWPSESPEQYVTLHIGPGQSTLDWGDPLELRMDSDMFLRPQLPATTYPPPTSTEKKVCPGFALPLFIIII